MLVSFFSANIPLYIEKNPVEMELELKTWTPSRPKICFRENQI